jgi:hypothetical protein
VETEVKALCAFAGKSNTRLDPKKGLVRTCAKGVCGGMVSRGSDCEGCKLHSTPTGDTIAAAPAVEAQPARISLDLLVLPCRHRSAEAVGTEECVACGGSVKLKVYGCALPQHGTCTVAAPGKSKRMSCLKCQREGLGFEPAAA